MTFNFTQEQYLKNINQFGSTVLFKTISNDTITPVLAALKLFKNFDNNHFLFESAEQGNNKGRFSMLGLNPDIAWKCQGDKSLINNDFANNSSNFEEQQGHPLQNLRNLINQSRIDWKNLNYDSNDLPAMCSGVFGYMGYDMARLMEKLPNNNLADDIKIADSIFIRPQIIVVFDSLFDKTLICAPIFKKENYQDITSKINNIETILLAPYHQNNSNLNVNFNFQSNYSKSQYCAAVEKSKTYITNGDIFQVLPSQRFTSNFDPKIPTFSFYRALRSLNPSPFLFYFKFNDFVLSGSSPEIMTALKNKTVTIRPLAGTRKRGSNPKQDQEIAAELLADKKEVAEHLMLIDLGRHDAGKVCKDGSVKVTQKMTIENYSHVMHISSNVEGTIRDDLDGLDALISGFPAGTVSGAPKIRAMEIIEEIEQTKRSFYAGCVGYFASNGDMETCITLRSALIKDNKIHLQAGAGVVFDSKAESEYEECINKAMALMKACDKIADY